MPGMDGWETLRQICAGGLTDAALAIISANAFEKGRENEVGISSEDFFTKPLRVEELLDWLGRRLALEWVQVDRPAAAAPAAGAAHPPSLRPIRRNWQRWAN